MRLLKVRPLAALLAAATGRSPAALLAAAALGPCAALLVSCGGDDPNRLIPVSDAEEMRAQLEQAANDVAGEECRRAQESVRGAQALAEDLPADVDPEISDAVREGMEHVLGQVEAECGRRTATETTPTQTTPTPEPEPEPTTTEEAPSPTTPTPPEPEPTPTTPSPDPSPGSGGTPPGGDDDDDGNGQGNGDNGTGGTR